MIAAALLISVLTAQYWPSTIPPEKCIKEICVFSPSTPAKLESITLRLGKGTGDAKIHVWRDIGSVRRPYLPFQFFEQDLIPPVTFTGKPDSEQLITLNLAEHGQEISIRNRDQIFIGLTTTEGGPRFVPGQKDEPNSYVEKIIASDTREMPTLTAIEPGFQVSATFSSVPPLTQPLFMDITEAAGLKGEPASAIAWVDGDGDLDDDLCLNGRKLFINENGVFRRDTDWPGEKYPATFAIFADFDLDGDLDAALGDRASRGSRILENIGNGKFVLFHETPTMLAPSFAASWIDANNDGYPDLYWANGWNFVQDEPDAEDVIWLNRGGKGFYTSGSYGAAMPPARFSRVSASANFANTNSLFVGTFRLQKDLLLEFTKTSLLDRSREFNISSLPSKSMGITRTTDRPEGAGGHALGADFADLDSDGNLDLLVSQLVHPDWRGFRHSSQTVAYFHQPKANGVTGHTRPVILNLRFDETPTNATVADFNGDGWPDIVWNSMYHTPRLHLGDKQGKWTENGVEMGLEGTGGEGIAWSDFDNDGRLDLAWEDSERGLRLLRNVGAMPNWASVRVSSKGRNATGGTLTVSKMEPDGSLVGMARANRTLRVSSFSSVQKRPPGQLSNRSVHRKRLSAVFRKARST